MERDVFKDRERAFEEGYFRAEDAKLLKKLQDRATLGDVAAALKAKLAVDDPALLERIGALGVTLETAPAFLLSPLVQVAWGEGNVTRRERDTVLGLAAGRGVEVGSPAHAQLVEWLERRPPDDLFDAALAAIKAGFSVLSPAERDQRTRALIDACDRIAQASGGIREMLGFGGSVSVEESHLLDAIAQKLRERPRAAP